MNLHWSRIIDAIAQDKIEQPEKFVDKCFKKIYPIDTWNSLSIENYFKLREYTKWHDIEKELYQSIHGNNPLKFLKEELVMKNIHQVI